MMTLPQYRVSWEAPNVQDGASARPLTDGSLFVTDHKDNVTDLVGHLLRNGYEKITVERHHYFSENPQTISESRNPLKPSV